MLPARIPGYQPRLLDELGALGEVAWVGRGSLGRDDGRVVLVPAGPRGAPAGRARRTAPSGPPAAPRRHPRAPRRGAARPSTASCSPRRGGGPDREVLDALWDLVWAGEVTNDTFAPLRALRWKRPAGATAAAARPADGLGPPEAAGRWSLVGRRRRRGAGDADGPSGSTRSRWRSSTGTAFSSARPSTAEGVDGGFAAVYPVLRALEEAGRIRRGYFVEGLGAAQFALAGAIDRLRGGTRGPTDRRRRRVVHLLAAADPANPYGAALPWPRRGDDDRRPFQRAAGAYVVLVDGSRRSTSSAAAGAPDPPGLRRARPSRGGARGASRGSSATAGIRELVVAQDRRRAGRRVSPLRGRPCSTPASWPATAASSSGIARARRDGTGGSDARGRHARPDRGRPAAVPRRARS